MDSRGRRAPARDRPGNAGDGDHAERGDQVPERSIARFRSAILFSRDDGGGRPAADDREIAREPIAFPDDRFEILRSGRVVFQRRADLADGGVDAAVGRDVHVRAPEAFDDLFARDEPARPLGEQHEQLHGLMFEPHGTAVDRQFVSIEIEDGRGPRRVADHGRSRPSIALGVTNDVCR